MKTIRYIKINKEDDDSWVWEREDRGEYTIKSAYLCVQENNVG